MKYDELTWKAHFIEVEGRVSHMYLDGEGIVTVGIGCVVFNPETLPMTRKKDNQPATRFEKFSDYNAVKALPADRAASYYATVCSTYLSDPDIDRLFFERLDQTIKDLQLRFGSDVNLEKYPEYALLAIVDMVFNLGTAGLFNKFPAFINGFRAKDWHICSQECRRKEKPEYPNGVSKGRNEWTRAQFQALEA